MMKPIIVFACKKMEQMARSITGVGSGMVRGEIQWGSFADSWPDFRIVMKDENSLRGRDVAFLAAFENPQDSVTQRWVMSAFAYYQARSLTIILPFFPTGTMERMDRQGRIVTAKSMARDLSSIPSCVSLKNRVVIWDMHALSEWFIFEGINVLPILTSAIPMLQKRLRGLPDRNNVSVVFPDEGAKKRFGEMFGEWPLIICDKHREGNRRIVTIKEGEPRGRHCVVVDDLAQTFGTQLKCDEVLIRGGAKKISMYATHLVAPNQSWTKICNADFPIEHFWTTNSCPWTINALREADDCHPFEVLPLDCDISKQILAVRSYFEN